ncbi:hypothetical protein P3T40_007999 [Paraburkholderia sp. EB58]|jgi:hypothetical protein|uniref:hypothetical protein n=1 Tax=Paraburkholderia sp. EB58 TaxID=3035125 RepID=UPI003D23DB4E
MIADTRYVQIDRPTIMKGFGYHPHRTLDEATEDAAASSDPRRVSVKQVATVLLVGAALACIHREISGASDGSLVSIITGYARGTLHHLASLLLNRGS